MESNIQQPVGHESLFLVKTRTCPACRTAIALLDDRGVAYAPILAEEHSSLTQRYDIHAVPTLVMTAPDGTWRKWTGVDSIRDFLREREARAKTPAGAATQSTAANDPKHTAH
jgi:ribonucleoside-triphosphate reductase